MPFLRHDESCAEWTLESAILECIVSLIVAPKHHSHGLLNNRLCVSGLAHRTGGERIYALPGSPAVTCVDMNAVRVLDFAALPSLSLGGWKDRSDAVYRLCLPPRLCCSSSTAYDPYYRYSRDKESCRQNIGVKSAAAIASELLSANCQIRTSLGTSSIR